MTDGVRQPAQLAQEARAAYQRGDYQAAERAYLAAKQGYRQAGDVLMAAEIANDRCVALLQADDPSGALASLEDAEQVFQLAGDQKRLALTIGNRAAALDALKRFDEALQSYEACAKLLKELGEHEQRAVVLQAASKIYYRRGKPLEALAVMRAGVGSLPHPNFRQRLLQKLLELPFSMLRGKK